MPFPAIIPWESPEPLSQGVSLEWLPWSGCDLLSGNSWPGGNPGWIRGMQERGRAGPDPTFLAPNPSAELGCCVDQELQLSPFSFQRNSQQIPSKRPQKFPGNSQQIPNQFPANSQQTLPSPALDESQIKSLGKSRACVTRSLHNSWKTSGAVPWLEKEPGKGLTWIPSHPCSPQIPSLHPIDPAPDPMDPSPASHNCS